MTVLAQGYSLAPAARPALCSPSVPPPSPGLWQCLVMRTNIKHSWRQWWRVPFERVLCSGLLICATGISTDAAPVPQRYQERMPSCLAILHQAAYLVDCPSRSPNNSCGPARSLPFCCDVSNQALVDRWPACGAPSSQNESVFA